MTDSPLEALAAHLCVPQKSGVYLTKNELIALARAAEGSLRINERKRMLVDVLRSPQTPAELSAMLGRLADFCRMQAAEYRSLAVAWPASAPAFAPWIARADASVGELEGLRAELALEAGPEGP